jgi:hypothetical protein
MSGVGTCADFRRYAACRAALLTALREFRVAAGDPALCARKFSVYATPLHKDAAAHAPPALAQNVAHHRGDLDLRLFEQNLDLIPKRESLVRLPGELVPNAPAGCVFSTTLVVFPHSAVI